jgi:hypothetical protein
VRPRILLAGSSKKSRPRGRTATSDFAQRGFVAAANRMQSGTLTEYSFDITATVENGNNLQWLSLRPVDE